MMHPAGEKENKISLYNKPTAASIGQRKQTPPPTGAGPTLASSASSSSRIPSRSTPPTPTVDSAPSKAQQELIEAVDGLKDLAVALETVSATTTASTADLQGVVDALQKALGENHGHLRRLFEEERARTAALEEDLASVREKNEKGRVFVEELRAELITSRAEVERLNERVHRAESEGQMKLLQERVRFDEQRLAQEQQLRELHVELERERGNSRCDRQAHEMALLQLKEKQTERAQQAEARHREEVEALEARIGAMTAEFQQRVREYEDQVDALQGDVRRASSEREKLRAAAAEKFEEMAARLQAAEERADALLRRAEAAEADAEHVRETYHVEIEKAIATQDQTDSEMQRSQAEVDELRRQVAELECKLAQAHQQQAAEVTSPPQRPKREVLSLEAARMQRKRVGFAQEAATAAPGSSSHADAAALNQLESIASSTRFRRM